MASQKTQNKIRRPAGSPHPFTGPFSPPSAPASLGLLQAGAAPSPPRPRPPAASALNHLPPGLGGWSLPSFKSQPKLHLLDEAFPNHCSANPAPAQITLGFLAFSLHSPHGYTE